MALSALVVTTAAQAQTGFEIRGTIRESQPQVQAPVPPPPASGQPTPRAAPAAAGTGLGAAGALGHLRLRALLVSDGQQIENNLIWRVYRVAGRAGPVLVPTDRVPTPAVDLPAGAYLVIASYGKAFISQRVDVKTGKTHEATLVLNAGGLTVTTLIERGNIASDSLVRFDIYADERDQAGERMKVVSGLRPGLVIRLNSGLYHLVSRLGDANAIVSADITVEAGKLSEAKIIHQAAKVTFKLVDRVGGEAIADTQWVILAGSGGIVKETAGALPTHMLAPGPYTVTAMSRGRSQRTQQGAPFCEQPA